MQRDLVDEVLRRRDRTPIEGAIRRANASTKPSSSASGSARLTYRIVPRCRRQSRSRRGRFQRGPRPTSGGRRSYRRRDSLPPDFGWPVACSRATRSACRSEDELAAHAPDAARIFAMLTTGTW